RDFSLRRAWTGGRRRPPDGNSRGSWPADPGKTPGAGTPFAVPQAHLPAPRKPTTHRRETRRNGGLMKLRTLTLCMMAAGSMLAASTGMAQPQPTTPAPATQGAAQQERQDQAQQNAAEQRADQASAQQDAKDQLDGDDEDFLENAAQSGAAEIEGSKMAQEKAKNPDVKAFADKMIQDHTKVSEELAALAKSKGYTPPTEPSMLMKAKLKTLSLTDDGFDEMYVDH